MKVGFARTPSDIFSLSTVADKTIPQTNLGNRVLDWPRGRVLGGSSAVNGLYL